MIENRKENIGVIEKKTGDILANIDDVQNVVIKHLNEVADKMKEKVTSSKKNTIITLSGSTAFVDCFIPAAAVSMDTTLSHFRCESVAPRVQQGLE
jgi:RNA-binding protein YlmH